MLLKTALPRRAKTEVAANGGEQINQGIFKQWNDLQQENK